MKRMTYRAMSEKEIGKTSNSRNAVLRMTSSHPVQKVGGGQPTATSVE